MGQTGSRNGAGSLREELGKVGQRRDGKVACDTAHAPAKGLQTHGVLVLADDGLLVAAEQHAAQRDRQDQTVESTGQDDHALRAAEDRHNKRGESDETDDEPLVVLGDEGVNGLEEGDGGVGRADDGGDTGGEQRETEETVADVAGSKAESLGCGVGSGHGKTSGRGEKGAMVEIEEEFGFPVYSVVDVYDIIEYLEEDDSNAENVQRIKNYLSVNGAK